MDLPWRSAHAGEDAAVHADNLAESDRDFADKVLCAAIVVPAHKDQVLHRFKIVVHRDGLGKLRVVIVAQRLGAAQLLGKGGSKMMTLRV